MDGETGQSTETKNDPCVRREILVWRDKWFMIVHRDYVGLRANVLPKLDASLEALSDNFITKNADQLLEDLIFPMLESFEGTTRRGIFASAREELHRVIKLPTLHGRERTSLPELLYEVLDAPWRRHPAFISLLNPTIFQRLNTFAFAKTCRQTIKQIADHLVFEDGIPSASSCKKRVIDAIDRAANVALSDA